MANKNGSIRMNKDKKEQGGGLSVIEEGSVN